MNASGTTRHVSCFSANNNAAQRGHQLRVTRPRLGLLITAAGPPHGAMTASGGAPQVFSDELRSYAMSLHTRGQAKEGKAPEPKKQQAWAPTKEGYFRFLIESKAVYEAFEDIVANNPNPIYRKFLKTGLERTAALEKDIAHMEKTWDLKASTPRPGGPGYAYAGFLRDLARSSPPAFFCHYYNFYFAHTAGGRMIGAQVSKVALDMWMGDFYKWEGEVSQLVGGVKERLNEVAGGWSRDEKDSCLRETARTFKYSGNLLKELVG